MRELRAWVLLSDGEVRVADLVHDIRGLHRTTPDRAARAPGIDRNTLERKLRAISG